MFARLWHSASFTRPSPPPRVLPSLSDPIFDFLEPYLTRICPFSCLPIPFWFFRASPLSFSKFFLQRCHCTADRCRCTVDRCNSCAADHGCCTVHRCNCAAVREQRYTMAVLHKNFLPGQCFLVIVRRFIKKRWKIHHTMENGIQKRVELISSKMCPSPWIPNSSTDKGVGHVFRRIQLCRSSEAIPQAHWVCDCFLIIARRLIKKRSKTHHAMENSIQKRVELISPKMCPNPEIPNSSTNKGIDRVFRRIQLCSFTAN